MNLVSSTMARVVPRASHNPVTPMPLHPIAHTHTHPPLLYIQGRPQHVSGAGARPQRTADNSQIRNG